MFEQRLHQLLEADPNLHTLDLAETLGVNEGAVLKALPPTWARVLPAQAVEALLNYLPTWGVFTTIVEKAGCIFEVKGEFPAGALARGYFNLNFGPTARADLPLHGHLKLANLASVVLVSKPFRGKESYCFAFVDPQDQVVFKVYLGRDDQRRLYPEQVAKFVELTQADDALALLQTKVA